MRANKGAPGVDKVSLAEFEKDLKNNLYKIWNRMSSGSYFPPPVRAVEIPKPHGGGTRTLGVPTVADRIAQTVVAGYWSGRRTGLPPRFPRLPARAVGDRRGRSVPRALLAARLGDRSGHPEVLRQRPVGPDAQGGRRAHRPAVGAVVCAPLVGRTAATTRRHPATTRPGTPQGSAVSPILANLFLHYAFDAWMARTFPTIPFERYVMTWWCTASANAKHDTCWRRSGNGCARWG